MQTVLIVDDESSVRNVTAAMLTHFGYAVLTASSGDDALAVYQRHNAPIDLLIADVIAPGMSGPALAGKLTALQPGLSVLYMSGYTHTQLVQKSIVEKGHSLLLKPFTRDQLHARVQELLPPAGDAAITLK